MMNPFEVRHHMRRITLICWRWWVSSAPVPCIQFRVIAVSGLKRWVAPILPRVRPRSPVIVIVLLALARWTVLRTELRHRRLLQIGTMLVPWQSRSLPNPARACGQGHHGPTPSKERGIESCILTKMTETMADACWFRIPARGTGRLSAVGLSALVAVLIKRIGGQGLNGFFQGLSPAL